MATIDPAIQAIIDELRAQIARLERTVEEQARKIEEQARIIEEWKRGHRSRSRPNSRKKRKDGQAKKKPGRKKGHEGSQREIPDKIDKEVERTKDECDDCHGALTPTGKTREHVIENVIPARLEVERNVLFEYLCQGCGQIHWSELPPEYGDEQSIRALVLFQKVVFGTRSERGTQVHAQFMSTAQTAHKQGIDHGNFIIEALAAHHSGKPPPSIFQS